MKLLRISLLAVLRKGTKPRVILHLLYGEEGLTAAGTGVNGDTYFEQAPTVSLVYTFPDILARIAQLKEKFGPHVPIYISKNGRVGSVQTCAGRSRKTANLRIRSR